MKVPGELSDFSRLLRHVDSKSSDGGRWLLPHPVRSCSFCTLATMSSLAEQHFNWSHFCQTRQAKTHFRIQGVPADTHTPTHTHKHTQTYIYTHTIFWWFSKKSSNFIKLHTQRQNRQPLVTAWIKGLIRQDSYFLLNCYMSPVALPHMISTSLIHLAYRKGNVTLLSFCWGFPQL